MRRLRRRRLVARTLRLETLEPRLPMAASSSADLYIGDFLQQPSDGSAAELRTALTQAHATTGVTLAHELYGLTGSGQTVAVIDSGVAYDHEALGSGFGPQHRVVGGWDFTEENDSDPYDDAPAGFHGSHVAGIIGSSDGRHTGVAPDVDLVALRVFNDFGEGYFEWVEKALQWVHEHRLDFEHPITAVNLSLGSDWNADTIPRWAMLEDEFAKLNEDGLFVSVSAGNSFQAYGQPGLSYPAASPFVVPVASVGDDGTLSDFSQRQLRVLAAPGEYITSTVPDYLFDFNGITDDFAAVSGTSMAAPYVAGSSVLVRQAMQLAGWTNITQDTIYDHLRDTADVFFDPSTDAYYHGLNVSRAVEAVLPEDDFGSSPETAHFLGTLTGSTSITGMIGRVDDRDYFTFTAGQTGTATFQADASDEVAVQVGLVGSGEEFDNDALSFGVVAGATYTIELGAGGGVGHYEAHIHMPPSLIDLGAVDAEYLPSSDIASGDAMYRVVARRTGILTVQADAQHLGDGFVDVEILQGNWELMASGVLTPTSQPLDVRTDAGQTWYIRVRGNRGTQGLLVANLIEIKDDIVHIHGTDAEDTFVVRSGKRPQISVNNLEYVFEQDEAAKLSFVGGASHDSIVIHGSDADESVTLNAGSAKVVSADLQVFVRDVESILVYAGSGTDAASLYDSSGNDRLTSSPAHSVLQGKGYRNSVYGFEHMAAFSTHGGLDSAFFYDSTGDDRFLAKSDCGWVEGPSFRNEAHGFSRVEAYSTRGGHDKAFFYDSVGDDRFYAKPDRWWAERADTHYYAFGFDRVEAYSTRGGRDSAFFYDSASDDRFYAQPDRTWIQGSEFYNYAYGFDRVEAYSTLGGHDRAFFYDSAGDDQLHAQHDRSWIRGESFYNYAYGFDRMEAYAIRGGRDSALFFDSPGSDSFQTKRDRSWMEGNEFHNYGYGFLLVTAWGSRSHNDRALFHSVREGDTLQCHDNYASVERSRSRTRTFDFETVVVETTPSFSSAEMQAVDYVLRTVAEF